MSSRNASSWKASLKTWSENIYILVCSLTPFGYLLKAVTVAECYNCGCCVCLFSCVWTISSLVCALTKGSFRFEALRFWMWVYIWFFSMLLAQISIDVLKTILWNIWNKLDDFKKGQHYHVEVVGLIESLNILGVYFFFDEEQFWLINWGVSFEGVLISKWLKNDLLQEVFDAQGKKLYAICDEILKIKELAEVGIVSHSCYAIWILGPFFD